MNKLGAPVKDYTELNQIVKKATMATNQSTVDFSNTEIAFAHKTNEELKKMAWLFNMMNKPWLVNVGSKLGLTAVKFHLPFAKGLVKNTIFEQFCGGTTLLECQPTINHLLKHNTATILDYGAEAKTTEVDFNKTMNETIRAIDFAATNESVPVVSAKVSGLARNALLEAITEGQDLSEAEHAEYKNVLKRMESISYAAAKKGVGVFFDAEESWVQGAIDQFVNLMMQRYNKKAVIIYNTFQLYRHDRLQFLMDSFEKAQREKYLLGAKLVRGAYMEKERERANQKGCTSPIQRNKAATDDAFNTAVRFCVEHYQKIGSCNASHNMESALLQASLIQQKGIQKDHKHLNFCQLYGMSDHLTFNLAKEGFNVAKYVVYGAVNDVFPYLVRRAQENSSVTGDVSRELDFILREVKRRSL